MTKFSLFDQVASFDLYFLTSPEGYKKILLMGKSIFLKDIENSIGLIAYFLRDRLMSQLGVTNLYIKRTWTNWTKINCVEYLCKANKISFQWQLYDKMESNAILPRKDFQCLMENNSMSLWLSQWQVIVATQIIQQESSKSAIKIQTDLLRLTRNNDGRILLNRLPQ